MQMPKIVIADDHAIVRAGIRAILEKRRDWQVCAEAEDGEALVRVAREHSPDIVIVDYSLPVLNGVEATRQLEKAAPKARVLIYTMYDEDMLIRNALVAGARGYVLKSEDDSHLIEGVEALIKGKTYFSPRVAAYLSADSSPGENKVVSQTLTVREREVVQLVAEGESNKSIANRWGVSIKTVDTHRTSAMKKLNLRSAVDLVRYAIRNKLILP